MLNYKLNKILVKTWDILVNVLLFIPRCICTPPYLFYQKIIVPYQQNKDYSDKYILKCIKFLDAYHYDRSPDELLVLEKSFYSEFCDYMSIPAFFDIGGNNRKKISRIYYNNSNRVADILIDYYKNKKSSENSGKLLTEDELKEYFTNSKGEVSYWYSNVKGRNCVKF